jgi:hypothetical protein
MRRSGRLAPFLVLLAAGCASAGAPPPPPDLGYDRVLESTAVYLLGDTSRIEIDAGGETIEAGVTSSAVLDVDFLPSDGGVTVSAAFRRFVARAQNPLGSDQTASEASIDGALTFDLDRRGAVTVTSMPEVAGAAVHFVTPEAMAATLFPRLPGGPVRPGDTWTDTIRVGAGGEGGLVEGTSVVAYAVKGDTVIAGRALVRVELTGEDRRDLEASEAGMEVSQTLAGSSTGWFLWDAVRGVPYEYVRESELTGRMEVRDLPFPLSLRMTSRNELRLVEEGDDG